MQHYTVVQILVINVGICFASSYVFRADDLGYGNVFRERSSSMKESYTRLQLKRQVNVHLD